MDLRFTDLVTLLQPFESNFEDVCNCDSCGHRCRDIPNYGLRCICTHVRAGYLLQQKRGSARTPSHSRCFEWSDAPIWSFCFGLSATSAHAHEYPAHLSNRARSTPTPRLGLALSERTGPASYSPYMFPRRFPASLSTYLPATPALARGPAAALHARRRVNSCGLAVSTDFGASRRFFLPHIL